MSNTIIQHKPFCFFKGRSWRCERTTWLISFHRGQTGSRKSRNCQQASQEMIIPNSDWGSYGHYKNLPLNTGKQTKLKTILSWAHQLNSHRSAVISRLPTKAYRVTNIQHYTTTWKTQDWAMGSIWVVSMRDAHSLWELQKFWSASFI